MPYLGNEPAVAYTSTTKDSFSGDGSTTAFTMSKSANVNAVRVVVENVIQDPTVAYTCSGTTLTFTSAPPSGTNNIYVVHLGPPAATVAPPSTINYATTFSDALTVSGAFTSQGIDDNANATAITIDSSENISIGDASYGGSLGQVRIINDASSSPASLALFGHNNVSDGTDFAKIQLAMQTGGVGGNVVAQITGEAEGTAENAAHLTFETATGGTLSEAMRITHDAKIGIGTSAPLRQLHIHNTSANSEIAFTAATNGVSSILFGDGQTGTDVYRGYIQYNHSDDALLFGASSGERARIDTNGKFMVGKTAANAASQGFETGAGNVGAYSTISSGNTWHVHDTSAYKFYVNANGGIYNHQSNNVNLSDQREKKNIETLDDKWNAVKAWTLKKFHYNSDEDSDAKRFGVIAQDLETDHPELISEYKKTDDETRKAVKEQQMMWMAVKALQEAMAKIETLETKVAALEAE